MVSVWHIQLFGGLRLCGGGRDEAKFRTQKTAALLAYLALFPNRTHPREELAARFWEEDAEDEARRSLRVALNSLRKQLETPGDAGSELLIADRTTIGLRREAFTTDVARFEDALTKAARAKRAEPQNHAGYLPLLLEAAALYSAPLLPGFYEDWILDERERLHSRFLQTLEDAETCLRKIGRGTEADAIALRRAQSESGDRVAGGDSVTAKDAAQPLPALPTPAPSDALPHFFTRFWGRDADIETVVGHLNDPAIRVLTLLGAGGIGKTRLSVEAARAWGGACVWVPLASVLRGEEIADAVRAALKLPPATGANGDDFETVAAHLRERAASGDPVPLLLFDNFEQVEEESGARFVAKLLRATPQVRILVSSRRRLSVPGECLVAVETLPLPGEDETDPQTLLRNPSVALFADRARSVTPDFAVTARGAAAVVALVRLLDGLPLAIELAAAWVSVHTPAQMVAKLVAQGERFALLASRKNAGRVERHRSLWNTIGWSYDLLTPELRALWRRLSVFHGGFTPDMARTVAGDAWTPDGLGRLRERSLIRLMEEADGDDPGEPRYDLLESLREFAGERVADEETQNEQSELRHRHIASLQQIATACEEYGSGAKTFGFIQRFRRELLNIRIALSHAEAGELPVESGLRLATGVSRLWRRGGYLREGEGFLSALVNRADATGEPVAPGVRAYALARLGELQRMRGQNAIAEQTLQEAIALFRAQNDVAGVLSGLNSLASLFQDNMRHDEAAVLLTEALVLSKASGDLENHAAALHGLGFLHTQNDDYAVARTYHEQELVLRLQLGEKLGIVLAYGGLAVASRHLGDYAASGQYLRDVFRVLDQMADHARMIPAFHHYGELMLKTGDWTRAAFCFGVAANLRNEHGIVFTPSTQATVEEKYVECRAGCGVAGFEKAFERGRTAPLPDAVAFVLQETG